MKYLTVGPMCRYAKDLPTLTHLMADEATRSQLRLDVPLHTRDIKIYYLESAGFSMSLWNVEDSIQKKMLEAVSHFKSNGVHVERVDFGCDMLDILEISICTLFAMDDIPDMLSNNKTTVSNPFLW
jgi:fatty acid amide hydrolase 2